MSRPLPRVLHPPTAAAPSTISPDEFLRFRDFLHRHTGLFFEESKHYFVEKRLLERLQATRAGGFDAWFQTLRQAPQGTEMQAVVNAMTVNETYFFREAYQFDCLVEHLLAEVVQRKPPGGRIRIWSVPSSTGEEPYSIAIYLLERWPRLADYEVEILSSDIDTQVLEAAQAGLYGARSVAELPTAYLGRHFKREGADSWRISTDLRDAIHFSRVNLCDGRQTAAFRHIDVVFCRNLLIYFDASARATAMAALRTALNPGGFLCLGHSESIGEVAPGFVLRRFPQALVYQKSAAATQRAPI